MRTIQKVTLAAVMTTALLATAVQDMHSHTPHSCPKNAKAHACHKSQSKKQVAMFQDSGPDGNNYDGCVCIFDCWGTPLQFHAWVAYVKNLPTRF